MLANFLAELVVSVILDHVIKGADYDWDAQSAGFTIFDQAVLLVVSAEVALEAQ